MKEITKKTFDGNSVRIITGDDGEPWFVASDISKILEYSEASAMTRQLDDDEKGLSVLQTPGGNQELLTISESGLYSAIMRSNKPEAKQFKRWVTGDVLPSIRKNGGYISGQDRDDPELIMAKALMVAQSVIDRKTHELENAQQQLALAAPKVEFVDRYVTATGNLGFRHVAKLLKAKEPDLRAFLIENRIMYRLAGSLTPYQNHIDAGRFDVKTGVADHGDSSHAFTQAKFTPKGVEWLAGELAKAQIANAIKA